MKEAKRILRKNRKPLLLIGMLLVLNAAASVAAGYSLSGIINAYEAEGDRIRALLRAALVCIGMYSLYMLINYAAEISVYRIERTLKNDLREMICHRLSSLSHAQLTGRDSGAYVSWLSGDADTLCEKYFKGLFKCISCGCNATFSFAVMTASSWLLGATAFALFLVGFVTPQLFSKKLERAAARRSAALEAGTAAYKDTIMGAGIFTLSGLRGRIAERIVSASDRTEHEIFLSNRTTRRVDTLLGVLNFTSQLTLSAVAALAAIRGAIPLGITLTVANLCGQFFNGLNNVMTNIMAIRSTRPIWEKYRIMVTASDERYPVPRLETISLDNVSFSYGERDVLSGRSLSFRAEGKYAIVGESGSGKTTILKLILGLLPGYRGRILYNDAEQQTADLSTLYDQIAYVDQQVYLFQDTLRFNITLGKPYSDGEIMSAVRAARLESFVESLPDGLDSIVRENGKNLSGGQRQRIALARGLIRRARLILLDEGTSALDEENAFDIEQSLIDSTPGVIFITHHLRGDIRSRLTGVYEV